MSAASDATAPQIEILPSILSSDFTRLGSQVEEIIAAGATVIHCDVMDGSFVPPITFGAQIVGALRDRLPDHIDLDVHLMIDAPERHVEAFAKAGASGITFHAEATPHVHRVVQHIRELGCRAGVAINPGTPVDHLAVIEDVLDLALVMTVNPGWGGQKLIPACLDKTASTAAFQQPGKLLQVDGGIDVQTAPRAVAAGAHWLVAGSAVYGADDPGAAFQAIEAAARGAVTA